MSKPRKRRRSRATARSGLPKGAYRVPTGGYVFPMDEPVHVSSGARRGKGVVIRCNYREKPDLRRLAIAIIDLAREEMLEKDPSVQHTIEDAAGARLRRPPSTG